MQVNKIITRHVQWNLCNPTPDIFSTIIYGPKVFLLAKIKPEYSDILYNPTNVLGLLVCWIRQLPLYYNIIYHRLVDVVVRVHPSVKITENCYYISL